MAAVGIKIVKVHEEEWSYIPVGGPLPKGDQYLTAFGAAANLVHPATGFSVSRSLREAPVLADAAAGALEAGGGPKEVAGAVWGALWPQEKRRQVRIPHWQRRGRAEP
jgi:lycopene epsilon-cyclase